MNTEFIYLGIVIAITIISVVIYILNLMEIRRQNDYINRKLQSDIKKSYNLTNEDLDFLIDLQNEMLTQDHVCQAAPRFWVVATDKHQELGTEDCFDGMSLYSSDDGEVVCDGNMSSIIEYVVYHYSEELKEKNIFFTDKGNSYIAKYGEDEAHEESFFCSEELLDFLREHNIISDMYDLIYYRNVHHIYPNTMFLTNRSCKEHIKINHYHYNEDAHSYAMTAWRSPEVSYLFEILDKIDWKSIKEDAYGKSKESNRDNK